MKFDFLNKLFNQKPKTAKPDEKKPVQWGKEVASAGKTTGRVFLKILTVIVNVILTVLLVGMIVGVIVGSVFLLYVKNEIDPTLDVDVFVSDQDLTTMIYYTDEDGNAIELEDERLHGSENRLWVSSADIPKIVKDAFVSIEDRRFYSHQGVDWLSTGRSALEYLTGSSTRGGSTITQQLVKNLTQEDEVRVQRKIQEITRALYLEKHLSKDEILTLYLNSVYLSRGCYGVQAASYKYFSKSVSELNLDEAACLASIIQSPSYYDPVSHPDHNQRRRQEVYNKMLEEGKITQAEHDEVYYKELSLKVSQESGAVASSTNSWFKDALINEVLNDLMEKYEIPRTVAARMLYSEGLQIYTTMDPTMQKQIEQIYLEDENFPAVTGTPLESAMVIMDYDGGVKALVGGRGEKTLSLAYNRATQAYRSPGSSIKPVSVYAPALDRGLITYGSVFDDVPIEFHDNNNPWPKNLPRAYNGLTTVNSALERSVNTVAVRILQRLTPEESFKFCREKAGLSGLTERYECVDGSIKSDVALAPLALGALTVGVTVEDMASAYTMLANDGIRSEGHLYTVIYDHDGKVLIDKAAENISHIAISAQTSFIMTKMMQNVASNGTGKSITLQNSINVAVKTGTAENDVDRWCVGYTPYYICSCWVGYDEPKAINTAANPAVRLFDVAMTKVHEKILTSGEPVKTFKTSMNGVVKATFCMDSGKLFTDTCAKDLRGNRIMEGWFTTGTVPQESCDVHVDVMWDKATQAVACEDCPEENLQEIALLRVTDREFPIELTVTDAEYTWRPWTPKDGLTDNPLLPFYYSLVPEGHYTGVSTVSRGAYNRFCTEHYVEHPEEETTEGETTELTEETTKPDKPTPVPTEETTPAAEETEVPPEETTADKGIDPTEETTEPEKEEETTAPEDRDQVGP